MSAAIAGLAIGVISTGMSFAQAGKQKKLQAAAEAEADAAMEAARGKLEVNFAEQMSIKKEGYELERDANLSAGAQAMAAGMESDRGGAATAGRVLAAQQAGQAQTRVAMGDEQTNIEAAIIEEDSRLRDLDVALDLEEVAGNQQKAADAQRMASSAQQQGLQQAVSTVGQAVSMVPLYKQNQAAQKAGMTAAAAGGQYDGKTVKGPDKANFFNKRQQKFTGQDVSKIDFNNMSNRDFNAFKKSYGNNGELFNNKAYAGGYQEYMTGQDQLDYFNYLPNTQ